jgi:hypothetical protein
MRTFKKVANKGKTTFLKSQNDNIFCGNCHKDHLQAFKTYKHISLCIPCCVDIGKLDVKFVMKQTGCSKKDAKKLLIETHGDPILAVIEFITNEK